MKQPAFQVRAMWDTGSGPGPEVGTTTVQVCGKGARVALGRNPVDTLISEGLVNCVGAIVSFTIRNKTVWFSWSHRV